MHFPYWNKHLRRLERFESPPGIVTINIYSLIQSSITLLFPLLPYLVVHNCILQLSLLLHYTRQIRMSCSEIREIVQCLRRVRYIDWPLLFSSTVPFCIDCMPHQSFPALS